MRTYSVIFSPTGGTERAANILESVFQSVIRIDLSKTDIDYNNIKINSDDLCIVAAPSFGGRVPQIAVDRLRKLSGNGAKTMIAVAYGNRAYEDTLLELKNELSDSGFTVTAAVAAAAEHSIMRQFGAGRPDSRDEEELRRFAQRAKEVMTESGSISELHVPGNKPYRQFSGLPMKSVTNRRCNQCGLCAALCPAGAISKENPSATDKITCITCMRCVQSCPNNARGLNKILLFLASQKMKKSCSGRKNNEFFL